MIRSFRDKDTEAVFRRERTRRFSDAIARAALRKLLVIDAAESLEDLRSPPGNRLERLSGRRRTRYSIRVNDQWRICFRWERGAAVDVEIVDYH